jgi:hypothetical protein
MPDDLQQQGTPADSSNASAYNPPPGEQSTNWEERFKGLQREYDKLQRSAQGKDAYNTQITAAKQAAERQLSELQAQYEGQINSERARSQGLEKEKTDYATRAQQLEAQIAARDARDNVRKELTQRHGDLLGWFESGYLTIPTGEDGKPLSGEALDKHVGGFRGMLGQKSTQDFQNTMSGATPPQFGTPASPQTSGMDVPQMEAWLNNPANLGHPDRSRIMDALLTEVEKKHPRVATTDSDWLNR